MNDKATLHFRNPEILFVSLFAIGFLPWAPGTFGSLVTILPLSYFTFLKAPTFFFWPLFIIVTLIACFTCQYVQKKYRVHDPSWIVIDEVLGMTLTWLIAHPHSSTDCFLLFINFRFFDIIKFWPASYFDQKVSHGYATVLDDLISGLYAALLFLIIKNYFPILS